MIHQSNAVLYDDDGHWQLSSLTALRALLPNLLDRDTRHGPFTMHLLDMHASNIFVDEHWNITKLIDFEFAPIVPTSNIDVPSWLAAASADALVMEKLDEYMIAFNEFIEAVEQEEVSMGLGPSYSQRLRASMVSGRFWLNLALKGIDLFPFMVDQHLMPQYLGDSFTEDWRKDNPALSRLWGENVLEFLAEKATQKQRYEAQLRDIFATAEAEARAKGEWDDSMGIIDEDVDPTAPSDKDDNTESLQAVDESGLNMTSITSTVTTNISGTDTTSTDCVDETDLSASSSKAELIGEKHPEMNADPETQDVAIAVPPNNDDTIGHGESTITNPSSDARLNLPEQ
jgi:hypothetical protein